MNDIFSFGFSKGLLRGNDNSSPLVYDMTDPTQAQNLTYGLINVGTQNNTYNVDPKQGQWMGNSVFSSAPFSVSMTGFLTARGANISGTGVIIVIGGTNITIDNTSSIQTYLDLLNAAGGGTLFLQPGTYIQTTALTMYSGVSIIGNSPYKTTINFNSTTARLLAAGTSIYTTGTLTSITSGVSVVGSGTSWLANLTAGSSQLFVNNKWYSIAAVTSDTTLILSEGYAGAPVIAGTAYRAAKPVTDVQLEGFTLTGSTSSAIDFTDVRDVSIKRVNSVLNNVGVKITNGSAITTDEDFIASCTSDGIQLTNLGFCNFRGTSSASNGGNGWTVNGFKTGSAVVCAANSNTLDGMSFTNVTDMLVTVEANNNGSQGFELVSGNTDIELANSITNSNVSDGVKMTATNVGCIVDAGRSVRNGGYGVNIAASSNTDNTILAPYLGTAAAGDNNTSGTVNDLGTRTIRIQQTDSPNVTTGTITDNTDVATSGGGGTNTDTTVTHGFGRTPKLLTIECQLNASGSTNRQKSLVKFSYDTTATLVAVNQITVNQIGTLGSSDVTFNTAIGSPTCQGVGGGNEKVTVSVTSLSTTQFVFRINGVLAGADPGVTQVTGINWVAQG